jgi:hypothetical protein
LKLLKGKRMEPAITKWACGSSVRRGVRLPFAPGRSSGTVGGPAATRRTTWSARLSTSSLGRGYPPGEGTVGHVRSFRSLRRAPAPNSRSNSKSVCSAGKPTDPRPGGATSVLSYSTGRSAVLYHRVVATGGLTYTLEMLTE